MKLTFVEREESFRHAVDLPLTDEQYERLQKAYETEICLKLEELFDVGQWEIEFVWREGFGSVRLWKGGDEIKVPIDLELNAYSEAWGCLPEVEA